jgi:hypothetical protein
MKNPDNPAFPFIFYISDGSPDTHTQCLTKREYAAIKILSGLCIMTIPGQHNNVESQKLELVPHAIQLADELLKQLES